MWGRRVRWLDEAERDAFEQACDRRPRVGACSGDDIFAIRSSLVRRGLIVRVPHEGLVLGLTKPTPIALLIDRALREVKL